MAGSLDDGAALDTLLRAVPEPVHLEGARRRIRDARAAEHRRTVVLDDDPTGSQSVHDVAVVTVLEKHAYEVALDSDAAAVFLLINSRSIAEPDAVALNREIGTALFEVERESRTPLDVVSRSDSTLRGHVIAEVRELNAARIQVTGAGFDGVLFAPAFFEAGRITVGDVHWARVGDEFVPVGDSEFARDPTFGYASSQLRDFLAERSGGDLKADQVMSIGLRDIREGGPDRVAEILSRARNCQYIVVNATDFADFEIVVLGLQRAQRDGRRFLYRTGPSFVRALIGQDPIAPLASADIWPAGHAPGHGLVIVGSHVGLTGRQLEAAFAQGGLEKVELSVPRLLESAESGSHVSETSARVEHALSTGDVVLYTSRDLQRSEKPGEDLDVARTVSAAVTEIVRAALGAHPAWIIAKGGITSHDVAVHGLGIRRATVLGQLLSGMISVLRPRDATAEVVGMPFVVFAGNVGDDHTLAEVIALIRGNE